MSRFASIVCLMLLSVMASAQQVRFHGTHYLIPSPNGVDYVVLFADLSSPEAAMEYVGTDANFRWSDYAGATLQQGTNAQTFYPQGDKGYVLHAQEGNVTIYVLDYKDYIVTATDMQASMDCAETTLSLTANIPSLSYRTPQGQTIALPRQGMVSYHTLSWTGEAYVDSVVTDTVTLGTTMRVGAPYCNTAFALHYDAYAALLGLEQDSMLTDEMEAVAVTFHPASVTAKRGEAVENEPQRPIDENQLSGSAPLEVQFLSNANKPVTQFFHWEIYKGSTLIASRGDEDQRYVFQEQGNYQVKVRVSNAYCRTDSVVFDISISESQLLVPNVFTPNGDGINDEFRVLYRSLAQFDCWVYNRWGKLVYHWSDPAKGWDGNIGGRPAPTGAYFYIIRARGTDADPKGSYHKITKRRPADVGIYQLSGSINLIR